MTQDILLIILSIGFVVLIIFICVAVGAMIKILIDVKQITSKVRKEAENISETMDIISDKAKSFFANSLVINKIIPALLGIISVGIGVKKAADKFKEEEEGKVFKKKKKTRARVYSEEEID